MLHDQYQGAALCAGDEGPASFQRQAYDHARHGVTTLFAALEVATRQAIRRGSYTSARQLTHTIGACIDGWADHPRPFAWTKDADEILGQIHRAKTKTNALTDH
jgi:hypothetical protein